MHRKPIRVAYLDATGEMGGAEHLLLLLLDGLPRDVVDPLLICAAEGPFSDQARARGIPTRVIPLPRLRPISQVIRGRKILNPLTVASNAAALLAAAFQMARILDDARPDLVQTNSTFAHLYGGLAARRHGLPCIWYFHDLVEARRLRGGIARFWRLLASVSATHVVAVSQAVLDSLGVDSSTGTVIYAGQKEPPAATAPDLRTRLGLSQDVRLVGYVGRIAHVKALDVLAKAAQRVIRTASQTHFVLFGEALFGQTGYRQALVEQVARAGIADHWHWLGYVQNVTAYLPQIDCVTLPSRREALGLALLEAGIAGKPAVGTRVGGIPEVIVDGETGILVPPEDPEALADAILRLIQNPVQADEMGRRAQARVRDVFGLPRYYTEFIALYDAILSSRENLVRL